MRKERETFTTSEMEARLVQKPTRRNFKDLEGMVVGKLTVHGWAGLSGKDNYWWCSCSCGERYFKIRSSSLQRGVTTSCGRAYENNGGDRHKGKEWFQDKLPHFIVTSSYWGYNHPVQITCKYCGEIYELDRAINAIQRSCHCQRAIDFKREEVFASLGYTSINGERVAQRGKGYAYRVQCNTCKLERLLTLDGAKRCPCHLGIESPCAVYVLTSPSKPYVKIGKALDPESRLLSINQSGAEDFQIAHVEWVSGEKCAYALESHLHTTFGGRNTDYRPGFSGDTEIFKTTVREVVKHLQEIEHSLKFLRKGVTPPEWTEKVKLPPVMEWSFEFDGYWYPSLKYFWKQYGYSDKVNNTEFLLENFTTHAEVYEWVNRGFHTQFGMPYNEYQDRLASSGVTSETVRNRVQGGWDFETALDTPLQRVRKVYYKGQLLSIKEFFEQFNLRGASCTAYRRREHADTPFIEGMIKTLQHFGINHITEDDIIPYQKC